MVKVEMELPELPEGYEYTGEYRPARADEWHMDGNDELSQSYDTTMGSYLIVRKSKWRKAKPSDLDNGPVKCRYWDDPSVGWTDGYLMGFHAYPGTDYPYMVVIEETDDDYDNWYAYCEVEVTE